MRRIEKNIYKIKKIWLIVSTYQSLSKHLYFCNLRFGIYVGVSCNLRLTACSVHFSSGIF